MNLEDLKAKCESLSLQVPLSGKRPSKRPFEEALRLHYARQDSPNGVPYSELNPMLAFNYWELPSSEQTSIWKDENNWLAQRKFNGVRLVLHFVAGTGVFAHSRAVSETTFRRSLLTDRLLFKDFIPNFTATIDSEAVAECAGIPTLQVTNSILHAKPEHSARLQQQAKLTIHVFDIVRWNTIDLRIHPLVERLAFLSDFKAAITTAGLESHFDFPPTYFLNKKAYFNEVTASGGEGVVLKNLDSPYLDSTSRSRSGWVKVKKSQVLQGYVSGFDRGRPNSRLFRSVAALHFSVQTENGPRVIAKVSTLSRELRRLVTVHNRETDTVSLNPQFVGKVARISGVEISQRSLRLMHASIVQWLDDMPAEDCRYLMSDLRALI